ncbi:MAG: hypothetical protein KDD58_05520 [Bdellovibrionales bacterium]|nr:hypothetical protein [Bdellovibrionales bacterium]
MVVNQKNILSFTFKLSCLTPIFFSLLSFANGSDAVDDFNQFGVIYLDSGATCPDNTTQRYGAGKQENGQWVEKVTCTIEDPTKPVSINGWPSCAYGGFMKVIQGEARCMDEANTTVYTGCPAEAAIDENGTVSCGVFGRNDKKNSVDMQKCLNSQEFKNLASGKTKRSEVEKLCEQFLAQNTPAPPEDGGGGGTTTPEPPPDVKPLPEDQDAIAKADKAQFEAEIEAQCKPQREDAEYCCGPTAMGCLIGAPKESDIGAIASVGTMLAQALIANRQLTSMAENCDSQAGLANFGAGVNTAMATQCHMKRSTCDSTCTSLRDRIKTRKASTCSDGKRTCEYIYENLIAETTKHINKCETLVNAEVDMGTRAATTFISTSQMANICKEVISMGSPPPVAPGVPGNNLCSDPTDLSNPYCRQQFCSQPGSMNLPECQGANNVTQNKLGGGSGSSVPFGAAGGTRESVDLGGADESLGNQLPSTGNNEIGDRSVVATQGGTSGGVPGGGGTGGGGGGAAGGGGGQQKGLKTDILGGLGGGSGYSVSSMGFGGDGGYSNPVGSGGRNAKAKPFDLAKYLPKKPPQRKLAGLGGGGGGLNGQIAGKHENIWSRVTNKYIEYCVTNRLYCPNRGR